MQGESSKLIIRERTGVPFVRGIPARMESMGRLFPVRAPVENALGPPFAVPGIALHLGKLPVQVGVDSSRP
jgi:hypothetical protein